MKVLTHNLLNCNKKACAGKNFPLKIVNTLGKIDTMEFDEELIKRFLKKVDMPGLTSATKDVCMVNISSVYIKWILKVYLRAI
jgi:hypothetical protein